MNEPPVQTVSWAPCIYGERGPSVDDPAELYHEASKVSPRVLEDGVPGTGALQQNAQLRASTARSVKRHPQARRLDLPQPRLGEVGLAAALELRRSSREFGARALRLDELASLLHAAHGVTGRLAGTEQPIRTVPSGGALYPLEIYAVVRRVERLVPGLYHHDPLAGALEVLLEGDLRPDLGRLTVYPELLLPASVVFVVTAMFWRTRFKYGLRGYRFALLEAGHLAQNLLLAAAGLGLAAVPVGGFFDRAVDDLLGADGVDESAIYAVSVGPAGD